MKKNRGLLFLLTFILILGVCFQPNRAQAIPNMVKGIESFSAKSQTISTKKGEIKVHFLDVGQADCTIVEANNKFLVIDAGTKGSGSKVVKYLEGLGAKKIDYIIGTHPHEDHIGGLAAVIKNFKVGKIILTPVTHTTKTFENLINVISNKGLKITKPKVGEEYTLGDASFTIIAPNADYKKNLNNWSVGIKLIHKKKSFVIYGDAEAKAEKDIVKNKIDISADVLKISHHGSDTSSSKQILKAISPKFAVISVGKSNKYKHPSKATIKRLKDMKVKYFRTDEQGTIVATSDGKKITWSTTPSKSTAGGAAVTKPKATPKATPKPTPKPTTEKVGTNVYITKTGTKYHILGCSYLKSSSIEITLKDAKSRRFTPCSRCNPSN